jgi:uncharacterized protein (UPF0264 family)
MGHIDSARVDSAAVVGAAQRYDLAAGLLDGALHGGLSVPAFGGASAGRDYHDSGVALRRDVDVAVGRLRAWSRAGHEISSALRASATGYAQSDAGAARRIG